MKKEISSLPSLRPIVCALVADVDPSVFRLMVMWKTKQDRLIVTMEYYTEVGNCRIQILTRRRRIILSLNVENSVQILLQPHVRL